MSGAMIVGRAALARRAALCVLLLFAASGAAAQCPEFPPMQGAEYASILQANKVPISVAVGDLDADGDLDLAVAHQVECSLVTDFNNDGVSNSTDISDFINRWFEDRSACGA